MEYNFIPYNWWWTGNVSMVYYYVYIDNVFLAKHPTTCILSIYPNIHTSPYDVMIRNKLNPDISITQGVLQNDQASSVNKQPVFKAFYIWYVCGCLGAHVVTRLIVTSQLSANQAK